MDFKKILAVSVCILTLPLFVFAQGNISASSRDNTSPLTKDEIAAFNARVAEQGIVFLQSTTTNAGVPGNLPGTINCFDYYHFNSVQVDIQPSTLSAKPDFPLPFKGKIKNANDYPIVGGSVYVKIFKKQNTDSLSHQNGDLLVDQFVAKTDIALPAKGERDISFAWIVPRSALSGEYEIATFFYTYDRFNLLGLTFSDDVVGNKADFSIKNNVSGTVEFDKNAVTINGKPYNFAAPTPKFTKDEPVRTDVKLKNTTGKDQQVIVSWNLYDWDALRSSNLITEKNESISIKSGETKVLSFKTSEYKGTVSYLVVQARYQDSFSILDIRFSRSGIDQTRMNFPSINAFPLKEGELNTVFSCVHSTNLPLVPDSELSLILRDRSGADIYSYVYTGDVTGAMMGVKSDFTPKKNYDQFVLTATLKKGGQLVDTVDIVYDCAAIDAALCFPKTLAWSSALIAAILVGLCFVGAGVYFVYKRKRVPTQI